MAHSDYILGSDAMATSDDDLYTLIEASNHKQIKLYVYNSETDSCREVQFTLTAACRQLLGV